MLEFQHFLKLKLQLRKLLTFIYKVYDYKIIKNQMMVLDDYLNHIEFHTKHLIDLKKLKKLINKKNDKIISYLFF